MQVHLCSINKKNSNKESLFKKAGLPDNGDYHKEGILENTIYGILVTWKPLPVKRGREMYVKETKFWKELKMIMVWWKMRE